MPANFITEGLDMLSGGGVVGGIVAAATTFGWWLRRERYESAKNESNVAEANASTGAYKGQAGEINSLRERLNAVESAYIAQSVQVAQLMKKISELEAKLIGINVHHENLILCEICVSKNEKILHALDKTLKGQ